MIPISMIKGQWFLNFFMKYLYPLTPDQRVCLYMYTDPMFPNEFPFLTTLKTLHVRVPVTNC